MAKSTRHEATIPVGGAAWENSVALGVGIFLALGARWALRLFPSGDFTQFTAGWLRAIGDMGPIAFLGEGVTNYAPLYTYGMIVAHYLFAAVEPVVAIKLIGLPFDFLCAYYVAQLVRLVHKSDTVWTLAFVATLFAPTVLINGAMWGQADVIYTTGLVAFVYYIATKREMAACIALGLSFAVKLQTIFLAPLVLILLLAGRVSPVRLLIVPGVYIVSVLPAWLCGRGLWDLLTVYYNQANYYPRLTSNAPHLYQWFPSSLYEMLLPAGLWWAAGIGALFAFAIHRARPDLTARLLVELAAISVVLVPFCTPKMHERYFFPADVLAIAFAFVHPRLAFIPVTIWLCSFFSYTPFLLRQVIIPVPYLALIMTAVLVIMIGQLARRLWPARFERSAAE